MSPAAAPCAPRRVPGAFLLALLLAFAVPAAAQGTREYDLKAVFLFRFASFVEWPEAAFRSPEEPLVIGVLGQDPFGPALDDILRSETARSRPIQVRRFAQARDVNGCQILFISRSEGARLGQVLHVLRGRPMLLVSDIDHFAGEGGMIGFTTAESRVQLTINMPAVRAAGLTVSSKLLRLARVIEG